MGLAPLRRSAEALPIACDASNARTMAVRKYHYVFCALSPASCYTCFAAVVLFARFSRRRKVMAHPPYGSAQKERIRFALCCVAVLLRRFLCQGSKWLCCRISSGTEKGEERRSTADCGYFSVLKLRTAIISLACSRSRMSLSIPK